MIGSATEVLQSARTEFQSYADINSVLPSYTKESMSNDRYHYLHNQLLHARATYNNLTLMQKTLEHAPEGTYDAQLKKEIDLLVDQYKGLGHIKDNGKAILHLEPAEYAKYSKTRDALRRRLQQANLWTHNNPKHALAVGGAAVVAKLLLAVVVWDALAKAFTSSSSGHKAHHDKHPKNNDHSGTTVIISPTNIQTSMPAKPPLQGMPQQMQAQAPQPIYIAAPAA